MGWERREKEREKERVLERETLTFPLNFPTIGPVVSGGAKGKVHPHGKSFVLRPKSRSFDKLQEVGVFS